MPESFCPICGQAWPRSTIITGQTMLVAALRQAPPSGRGFRDVYEGADISGQGNKRYFVSHGGPEVTLAAILEALRSKLIERRWPDIDGCWQLVHA